MTPRHPFQDTAGAQAEGTRDPDRRNAELALELGRLRSDTNRRDSEAEIARLAATVERQAAEIEALTRALEAHPVARHVDRLEQERADLEARIAALEARHQQMLASSSWKLTRPLRAVSSIVARFPGR